MACAVEERTREFGLCLALGASPVAILGRALGESVWIDLTGCAAGLLITLLLARVLGSALYLVPNQHGGVLYQVSLTNPLALGAACAGLLAVAALASLFPARRASLIDPLVALRNE